MKLMEFRQDEISAFKLCDGYIMLTTEAGQTHKIDHTNGALKTLFDVVKSYPKVRVSTNEGVSNG